VASHRKLAYTALVTTLQGVTPGAGYTNDLSGTGIVSVAIESWEKRREMRKQVLVRVRDGAETVSHGSLTGGTQDGVLSLVIELLVRATGDARIVDTANDLIADVRLAVDKNPRLGNAVTDAFVSIVGEPDYDFDGRVAAVTLVVAATYDWTQGAGI
jgi:hypothetical protein